MSHGLGVLNLVSTGTESDCMLQANDHHISASFFTNFAQSLVSDFCSIALFCDDVSERRSVAARAITLRNSNGNSNSNDLSLIHI